MFVKDGEYVSQSFLKLEPSRRLREEDARKCN